jgi:hypothetical protein
VFARSLASDGVTVSWTEETKLYASDGATGNQFGKAISLHGDTALITVNTGAVYIFTRSYGSDGINTVSWNEETKIDASANDDTGTSVSLYGDTALIGATSNDYKATAESAAESTAAASASLSAVSTGSYHGRELARFR